jgi:Fe-S cluster assembly ATP-binding protein
MKLEIKNLHVKVGKREVIKGVNLTIKEGEFHVLMGPNGSGKTTLSKAILGHPKMQVTDGDIVVNGGSILNLSTDERARLGIFMQFQQPVEIEGLGLISFLNTARSSLQDKSPLKEFMEEIKQTAERLHIKEDIIGRSLNYGFSGGEKKKLEILQMRLLKPKMVILDEPDSGLDVDAVKVVASSVNEFIKNSKVGILLITHYSRILSYMKPDYVHVMIDGMIVKNGGKELAERIEKEGYKT